MNNYTSPTRTLDFSQNWDLAPKKPESLLFESPVKKMRKFDLESDSKNSYDNQVCTPARVLQLCSPVSKWKLDCSTEKDGRLCLTFTPKAKQEVESTRLRD